MARSRSVALLLGAGASRAAPSGLPLFATIRAELARSLGIAAAEPVLARMAPEALLHILRDHGVDVDELMRRVLGSDDPNALHHVAAGVLGAGGSVWTTNLDTLIERAAATVDFERVLNGELPGVGGTGATLLKPHGSIDGGPLALSSNQVLRPLDRAWTERLISDFSGRVVAIVGYAGADLDLRPSLDKALSQAAEAWWFEVAGNHDLLRARYPEALSSGRLELRDAPVHAGESRPDIAFFEWALRRGLASQVPTRLVDDLRAAPPRSVLNFSAVQPDRLMRATLLDSFGRVALARRQFRAAIFERLEREHARRAAAAWWRTGLVHGAPWRPLVRAGLRAWTALAALPKQHLAWDWYLTLLKSSFQPQVAYRAGERALARLPRDPGRELDVASSAKLVGELERARTLAARVRDEALTTPDAGLAAAATLELSFAFRWLGDLPAARSEAQSLADGLGGLAGPAMSTWGEVEVGCVAGLLGRVPEALDRLHSAALGFEGLGDRTSVIDARTMVIPVLRLAGDRDGAQTTLTRAGELLEREQTPSRFRAEALLVERAELARERGDLGSSASAHEELSVSPHLVHRVLGLLGLGEVQRARGEVVAAARQALDVSDRSGMRFGSLHALVTIGLAEPPLAPWCEERIAALDYPAPERDDGTDGLLRFCVEPDPERHLIAFP